MNYARVIPFLLLVLFSCKNKPVTNNTKAVPDSSKFYPLSEFIQEQMAYVDLRNFEIYKKQVSSTKIDSNIISKEEFKQLAALFLNLDISKPDKKQTYTETLFHDLSTASYTLNYKTNQATDLVKTMDILLDEQTKMVKRVFIVSEFQKADSSIMDHHSWTANKQFQITRTIETASGRSNKTTTVYWIRK